jgi:LAO/AO transport system kinase
VNKADQPGAGRLEAELRGMVELGRSVAGPDHGGPVPTILRTVAVRGEGIDALCDAIDAHGVEPAGGRSDAARERARVRRWIIELAAAHLRTVLLDPDGPLQSGLEDLVEAVVVRALDPVSAADRLVGRIG